MNDHLIELVLCVCMLAMWVWMVFLDLACSRTAKRLADLVSQLELEGGWNEVHRDSLSQRVLVMEHRSARYPRLMVPTVSPEEGGEDHAWN